MEEPIEYSDVDMPPASVGENESPLHVTKKKSTKQVEMTFDAKKDALNRTSNYAILLND